MAVKRNSNLQAFLLLVKAGLWIDAEVKIPSIEAEGWQEVYRLATEQSVQGLVLAGLEKSKVKPPQNLLLQWIGEVQILEQQNKSMNQLVSTLIEKLRGADINALLLKGQGVAQCYERPSWRACGDVDLLLSDWDYGKAKKQLIPMAQSIEEENEYNQHLALIIDQRPIELHGSLRSGLWRRIDKTLDEIQNAVFCDGYVRTWLNGNTQVNLLRADEDVFFVFTHILQHFFQEGIGLRQLCDWCRLLWTYRRNFDIDLLGERLRKAGVMTEWKSFAVIAVDYLGMPVEAMPFYDSCFKVKGERILEFVLETGNFGHNRDYSYQKKYPYVIMKVISLWKHIVDFGRYFVIFPADSIRVMCRKINVGFVFVAKGK